MPRFAPEGAGPVDDADHGAIAATMRREIEQEAVVPPTLAMQQLQGKMKKTVTDDHIVFPSPNSAPAGLGRSPAGLQE